VNGLLLVGLLALCLGLVAAPILALRPTSRDRQLVRLRARAAAVGLGVRLIGAGAGAAGDADYLLPWEPADRERLELAPFPVLRKDGETWTVVDARDAATAERLRGAIASIAVLVTAVGGLSDGIAATWHERGDEENVDAIAAALRAVRDAWRSDARGGT
jgi:hypothetical protein